eukprot:scaffold214591_cov46-Attheya_sp.AAC.1
MAPRNNSLREEFGAFFTRECRLVPALERGYKISVPSRLALEREECKEIDRRARPSLECTVGVGIHAWWSACSLPLNHRELGNPVGILLEFLIGQRQVHQDRKQIYQQTIKRPQATLNWVPAESDSESVDKSGQARKSYNSCVGRIQSQWTNPDGLENPMTLVSESELADKSGHTTIEKPMTPVKVGLGVVGEQVRTC